MTEYEYLRNAIQNFGALISEEKLQPEIFGSAYCAFVALNGTKFRLVWDGKEEYAFLQFINVNNSWEDFDPRVNSVSNLQSPKLIKFLNIAKSLAQGVPL
jgi:hypothetical protein